MLRSRKPEDEDVTIRAENNREERTNKKECAAASRKFSLQVYWEGVNITCFTRGHQWVAGETDARAVDI
jgi:hypothetical protein